MNPTLVEALTYRDHGYALLPLEPRSKRPHLRLLPRSANKPTWFPLTQERAGESMIRGWFSSDPDAGIGIIGGDISGGIAVLDIDDPDFGETPNTPTSMSSESKKHVFTHSPSQKTTIHPWGSIRGELSYVAAPPSIHPDSGAQRSWIIHPNESSPIPLREVSLPSLPSPYRTSIHLPSIRTMEAAPEQGVMKDILESLNIYVDIGKAFRCVLPGHHESSPSATININRNGRHMYHDWHFRSGTEWFTLPEVRASQHCGKVLTLNSPSMKKWWDRMLYEAGRLEVAGMPLTMISDPIVKQVADGFLLLAALRETSERGQRSSPYTRSFVQHWCAVSEWRARAAIDVLEECGFLCVVGYRSSKNGSILKLYSTEVDVLRF